MSYPRSVTTDSLFANCVLAQELRLCRSEYVPHLNDPFTYAISQEQVEAPISYWNPQPFRLWENQDFEKGLGSFIAQSVLTTDSSVSTNCLICDINEMDRASRFIFQDPYTFSNLRIWKWWTIFSQFFRLFTVF